MSNKLIQKTLSGIGIAENLKFFYDFESYSGDYVMPAFHQENPYSGKVVNYDSSFHDEANGSGFFHDKYIEIQNTSGITSENATIIFSQRKTGSSNGVIFSHLDQYGPSGWEIGINQANKYYFKNFVDGIEYYQTLPNYLSDQNVWEFR